MYFLTKIFDLDKNYVHNSKKQPRREGRDRYVCLNDKYKIYLYILYSVMLMFHIL